MSMKVNLSNEASPDSMNTELEVTKRVKLQVGSLEIDVNEMGFGSVKIDGNPISVRKMTIQLRAGYVPIITAELVPIPVPPKDK